MKRLYNILIVALIPVSFATGLMVGRKSVDPVINTIETVRIDTSSYRRPSATSITRYPKTITVPQFIFVDRLLPSQVMPDTAEVATSDSMTIQVPVETRIYEDSLYRAQVSGPVVGSLAPSLDWINVYNRTRTVTQTVVKRNRFVVTAGIGAAWTPRGIQPTAGVQVGVVLWRF